jgi:hypothetical protein
MIGIMALVLVISIGFLVPKAAAQSDKYSKMASVDRAQEAKFLGRAVEFRSGCSS